MGAEGSPGGWGPWALLLACVAGTYLWRGLGVALSGRVRRDGALFEWLTCVTYAMLAGLVARIMILPVGPLAATPLAHRLAACAVALLVLALPRGSVPRGLAAGTLALIALSALQSG